MLDVVVEFLPMLGTQSALLCIGSFSHEVGKDADSGEYVSPDEPNNYDMTVISDRLIISAWGYLKESGRWAVPEATTVQARKNITSVTTGQTRFSAASSGTPVGYKAVQLTFSNDSELGIPIEEDVLTAVGAERLNRIVPTFYVDMSN